MGKGKPVDDWQTDRSGARCFNMRYAQFDDDHLREAETIGMAIAPRR